MKSYNPKFQNAKQNQHYGKLMFSHNQSTLLAAKRTSIYYPPTGTGRDTYIMIDNGGTNSKFSCQGVPELGNYMKFGPYNRTFKPVSTTKFQKYASDGSGRDKYVISKHGGQFFQDDQMNLKLLKFKNTMRDGGEWRKKKLSNHTQQSWKSVSAMKKQEDMRKTQPFLNNRLSVPKKMTSKYEQKMIQVRKQFLAANKKQKHGHRQVENQEIEF